MRKLGMKQISIIVSVAVFTILIIAVIIILNATRNNAPVDVLKEKTRIGLIVSGPVDDNSWNRTHYGALMNISDELNLDVVYRENIAADEKCIDVIRSLVTDENCLVVIGASLEYGDVMMQAANEFPERFFFHSMGTEYRKNLGSFFGRMYQYRYLSGIVAGLHTKSNSIGYIASYRISDVNRDINAFTLGVRSVAPDAVVHVEFTDSWTDDAKAAASAEKMVTGYGADVLAMHTNSLAPLDTAQKYGIWAVGCNYDNSDKYPDIYLTGCVWKWENYYREQILSCLQGKFRGEHSWLGIESGIMDLVDPEKTHKTPDGCVEAVNAAKDRFESCSYDVFYGPVADNEGRIRIGEGESMSDDNMLNYFDWYVEGVDIVS